MLLRLSVLGYPKNRTIATGWNVLFRLSLRVLKKYENFCNKMQCAAQTLSFVCFVCFDLGFHTSNPVIKYRSDASCMSYMEARAEMP